MQMISEAITAGQLQFIEEAEKAARGSVKGLGGKVSGQLSVKMTEEGTELVRQTFDNCGMNRQERRKHKALDRKSKAGQPA